MTDSKRVFRSKVTKLAKKIQKAKHIVILTGAGISTSAGSKSSQISTLLFISHDFFFLIFLALVVPLFHGITYLNAVPDFRGRNGIWTVEEREKKKQKKGKLSGKKSSSRSSIDKSGNSSSSLDDDQGMKKVTKTRKRLREEEVKSQPKQVSFESAKPTLTHRAIAHLSRLGIVKYCITQNVDGLHMRSGLSREKHCFLHGCIFTEKCPICGKEYFHDFDVGGVSFQKTGRQCTEADCPGELVDTILDWEDALPEDDWERSQDECEKSDLVITLGTSLRMEPAASLTGLAKEFVIVNMQKTPYDTKADLIIHAPVDDVIRGVLEELGVEEWDDAK